MLGVDELAKNAAPEQPRLVVEIEIEYAEPSDGVIIRNLNPVGRVGTGAFPPTSGRPEAVSSVSVFIGNRFMKPASMRSLYEAKDPNIE